MVAEVEDYLQLKEATELRRKEQLYNEWKKHVFMPIQKQIGQQLEETSATEIERRNLEAMNQFIDIGNKKVALSRDIIITDEYNPLNRTAQCLKYKTSAINRNDPLKRDVLKLQNEKKMIAKLTDRKQVEPKNRDVLDLRLWDKLEATPHGRYAMMFKEEQKQQTDAQKLIKRSSARSSSSLPLDHYNISRDQTTVTSEFFPNRKRVFPEMRLSKDMKGILNQQ
jgi:hypothetical protein